MTEGAGAVAASSGAVALFHAIGVTPEAPTLPRRSAANEPQEDDAVSVADLEAVLADLSTVVEGAPIGAVALGHAAFLVCRIRAVHPLLAGFVAAPGVALYVTPPATPSADFFQQNGWLAKLEVAGFHGGSSAPAPMSLPSCAISRRGDNQLGQVGPLRPANIGVDVAFGSLEDCLASAAPAKS